MPASRFEEVRMLFDPLEQQLGTFHGEAGSANRLITAWLTVKLGT